MSKIRGSRKHWYGFCMPYGSLCPLRDRCASNTQPCSSRGFWPFRYCKRKPIYANQGMSQDRNGSHRFVTSLSLVPAFGRQHCWTINSSEKGFFGSEWQKNTTRDSINISLKLYFNINVKGDFKYQPIVSHEYKVSSYKHRLQAVPFWIVERSREIAEREKTGANERRWTWGEAFFPASPPVSSRLFFLAPVSLRCERTLSTNQRRTACSLFQTVITPHKQRVVSLWLSLNVF